MNPLYNSIGVGYDTTRACDPDILTTLHKSLDAPINARILDLACGTGNYTIGLNGLGYQMQGLDISDHMLSVARSKAPEINWIQGNADTIPFAESTFDGCVCTLACHHFKDLSKVFSEVFRVMKPGRFVLMSSSHEQIRNYWLNRYFPNEMKKMMTYIPDIPQVIGAVLEAGFRLVRIEPFYITEQLQDNFLGARIERPELYLNDCFRNGMSIFARYADPISVEAGCQKLREELDSGVCRQFLKHYRSKIGEYYFLVVEKC